MFDYLRFRWRLRKTELQRRAIDKRYDQELAKLKATNPEEHEIADLRSNRMVDVFELDDEVAELRTNYFMSQARRLMLDLPDPKDKDLWEEGVTTGRKYLSRRGTRELQVAIRAEKKAIRETGLMWVAPITSILGLVVALAAIMVGRK